MKRGKTQQKDATGRKLYTPEVIQAAVISERAKGKRKSRIAKELGIDRNTVARILNQPEVAQHIQQTRSDLFRALPKMRERYVRIALKGRAETAAPVISKVLEGLQVFVPKAEREATLRLVDPLASRGDDELDYYAKYGQWPTPDEREYYTLHKYWPQEEKLFA